MEGPFTLQCMMVYMVREIGNDFCLVVQSFLKQT